MFPSEGTFLFYIRASTLCFIKKHKWEPCPSWWEEAEFLHIQQVNGVCVGGHLVNLILQHVHAFDSAFDSCFWELIGPQNPF